MEGPKHEPALDWMRGIAAMLVFLGHVRGGFFVSWGELDASSRNAANFVLFAITRLGHEAVIVFFVLSGTLVGGHAWQAFATGRFSLGHYAIARIARLETVLVPALLLTGILEVMTAPPSAWEAIQIFASHVTFMNGILVPTVRSNAPLWSLAFEWWFYTLFGLGLASISSKGRRAGWLSAALICTVALLARHAPSMLAMFPLWLLGWGAAVARRRVWSTALAPVAAALCAAAAGLSVMATSLLADYALALAITLLVVATKEISMPKSLSGPGTWLAAFSFSLYAVHYPIWGAIQQRFVPTRVTHAGVKEWIAYGAMAGASAVACYAFFLATERRTPAIRSALIRQLHRWQERSTAG